MKRLEDKKLLIVLVNLLLILVIIKICKVTGFCITIIDLISPLFFGYVIAWVLRPIIEKLKKYNISPLISTIFLYVLLIGFLVLLFVTLIPKVAVEVKDLVPQINDFINGNKYLLKIKESFVNGQVSSKMISNINNYAQNMFSTGSTIVYSFIISFFLLANNLKISYKLLKNVPAKLIKKISKNLRIYVKGTFLDMLVLFVLASVAFFFAGLPSFLLFSFLIALTNVIPYIGPYIGGIPAVLVGLSVSSKLGLIILLIVIGLQIIEGSIVQPYIMSKSLKVSPILIIIGLIIFSHFLGIVGMIISTPVVSIVKILYDYYKKNKPKWFIKVLGKL